MLTFHFCRQRGPAKWRLPVGVAGAVSDATHSYTVKEPALCAAWDMDGKTFTTGHTTGETVRWSSMDVRPLDNPNGPALELCSPMTRLHVLSSGATQVTVHDGGPTPLDPLVNYLTVAAGEGAAEPCKLEFARAPDDVLCVSSSPWPQAPPDSIIALVDGHLEAFALRKVSGPSRVVPPHGLELQRADITCTAIVADCSREFLSELAAIGSRRDGGAGEPSAAAGWPATGGTAAAPRPTRAGGVLVLTAHTDGQIRFWELSGERLLLLCLLPPSPVARAVSTASDRSVSRMALSVESRKLVVAHINGVVLVYQFNSRATAVAVATVDCQMEVAPQKPPPGLVTPDKLAQLALMGVADEAGQSVWARWTVWAMTWAWACGRWRWRGREC
jgi:hypothetical protein